MGKTILSINSTRDLSIDASQERDLFRHHATPAPSMLGSFELESGSTSLKVRLYTKDRRLDV